MRWYWKARSGTRALASTAALSVIALVIGSVTMPTLSLAAGVASVPFALVLPLGFVAAVLWSLDQGLGPLETSSVRPVSRLDAFVAVVLVTPALIVGVLGPRTGWQSIGDDFARNVIGLVGVGLIARRWLPLTVAGASAAIVVVVSMVVGSEPNNRPRQWAWVLANGGRGPVLVASLLAIVGLLVTVVPNRTARAAARH